MIGRALKQLRAFHRLSQKDLASQLGISGSYLSEIENETKKPSLEIIEQYSSIFKVPASSILYFSENLNEKPNSRNRIAGKILKMLEFVSDE